MVGGTGKTFCFNTILAHVRSQGRIALATASSGIAAILLMLGRTLHSRAKVPRKPAEDQPLNITAQSDTATLFRRADVIIIDTRRRCCTASSSRRSTSRCAT